MTSLRKRMGARLKELRLEQDLAVDRVAELVRVDRTHIYNVERGDKEASVELLTRLATVYRVDLVDLFTFPEEHIRHRWRELARLIPNAKLASIVALVEKELGSTLQEAATSARAPATVRGTKAS